MGMEGVVRGRFEVGDALFEVAEVVDTCLSLLTSAFATGVRDESVAYLQNGQLMHLLILARGNHILQDAKLFVHLRPPPSLNQTMGSLPRYLAARYAGRAGLLLLVGRSRGRQAGVLRRFAFGGTL